ncbi:MAG: hypothetical protein JWP57_706, partial [Spirosoma sp.]|nr:hypothetical protein [Spirosoma sp.]
PSQWSLSQNIPGITITTGSATGNLDPGVGSNVIANTITIGVRATLGSNIYEYPVRILNRDAANPPPTVNPFPDTVITATGAQTFSVASTFSDTDALTVQATTGVGYPLPAGITFNPANQSITVAADYPNGALAIVLTAVDTAGNSVQDAFLLTINRAVAPNITVVSTTIIGARFINEGSFSQYRLRRTYSNGQVSDISNIAYKSLEGWREGDNIDNEGNVRIPANTVAGDSRPLVVVMVAEGVRYTYDVNVVDISSVGEQNPAGTESCVNYARLTQAQFDALSQIVLYAYVDMQTPSGQLSYTARPFVSQAEATLLLPSKGQPGSVVGFNFHRVTQAGAPVGATVYNDSRADHILAGTAPYWPVQAGFYATNVTLPSGGNNGSYTLLQANACGVISVHTDNVPLIAN